MTKRLSIVENELIREMCYTNSDTKILVELNRIRKNMNIPEVVTIAQVTASRIKMDLHKTQRINSVVKKKKNNGTN